MRRSGERGRGELQRRNYPWVNFRSASQLARQIPFPSLIRLYSVIFFRLETENPTEREEEPWLSLTKLVYFFWNYRKSDPPPPLWNAKLPLQLLVLVRNRRRERESASTFRCAKAAIKVTRTLNFFFHL
ncbi:hypothetical protein P3X46_024538 [Hevea brasiliensis]|uniref:Uncharacterized protein n=1 Tax=Hevea brasiliensis TaxID=3981 RepID=A0ABQ9L652_HEVBR|nr:hypothetical protein P3X46_024538 [Hevea brasiliensis]